jgi:hypothetical protein
MSKISPSFMMVPNNPHDLFQVARMFLDGVSANISPTSSYTNFSFSSAFSSPQIVARWTALLASVPNGFQGTLLRCINANLRSFHPKVAQLLNADPWINVALARAKTDRTDIRIVPSVITPMLAYSYYASLADTFGTSDVRSALAGGELLMVGIRNSSSTLANSGRGSYDDAIVIVKGVALSRTAIAFPACTEPGAQYAHRAQLKPKGKPNERLDDRYAGVTKKYDKVGNPQNDGVNVNNDEFIDAGRLIEGTYQYTEKDKGHLKARAFIVGTRVQKNKESVFAYGSPQITERDTNGDGLFTAADPMRIDLTGAGVTMYIHRGNVDNGPGSSTSSSGCQTIPSNHYPTFLSHIPVNTTFYYVLINATA